MERRTLEGMNMEAIQVTGNRSRVTMRVTSRLGAVGRLLLVAIGLLASGCAAAQSPSMAQPVQATYEAPGAAPAAPPPSMAGEADEARATSTEPAPKNRPGLGTEWGEARVSPIEDVAFDRADETRPLATTQVHYNDEAGVEALAAHMAARGHRAHQSSAAGGAIAISLQDGDGNPLDVVQAAGQTFVIGEAGQRYTIVLENRTGHRFEAVSTVDGLDVITGKPGSIKNRGYLLLPYATLEIDGFRQSEKTVAAFRFGRVGDSYAAKMGNARNVGVIGIAFFGEQGDPWTPWTDDELRRRETARPFPGDGPSYGRFAPPPRR